MKFAIKQSARHSVRFTTGTLRVPKFFLLPGFYLTGGLPGIGQMQEGQVQP
jgi:hypothetical protein